jgi:hypothetical protein
MVRIDFDLVLWLSEQEAKKLDTTAKPIYYSAYNQLYDAYRIAVGNAKAAEGLDAADRSSYLDWLAQEYQQQRAALAAMTFALLARTVVQYLGSMLRLDRRHFRLQLPPENLDKLIAEYQSTLGISLEGLFHFATVREVVLARNSALHPGGKSIEDYMLKTEKRCLDEFGNINLTPELLEALVAELKQFVTELGREMSQGRAAHLSSSTTPRQ